MKLNNLWKGLIMAIVGFVSTTISETETFNFAYVAVATSGFTIVYLIKNWAMPSVSAFGIDLQDILSGIILAVGMGLSSYAAQIITIGVFEWSALWVAVSGAVIGYFAKTIPQKPR